MFLLFYVGSLWHVVFNVGPAYILMLGQRLRRWTNIKPTLGQRLVFAEMHAGSEHCQCVTNQVEPNKCNPSNVVKV